MVFKLITPTNLHELDLAKDLPSGVKVRRESLRWKNKQTKNTRTEGKKSPKTVHRNVQSRPHTPFMATSPPFQVPKPTQASF